MITLMYVTCRISEKEELLSLCVSHVNSAAYRRRGSRTGASPFSTLKGFTNNINDFINSAFDIRNGAQPAPAPPSRGCGSNILILSI